MRLVFDLILRNLRHLLRFGGRDTRMQFWPYAGFIYLLMTLMSTVAVLPTFLNSFIRMGEYARANPDKAEITAGPGSYSIRVRDGGADLMPDFTTFIAIISATAAVCVILLAAAVVRRLHDSGRSGAWGLMPLPFLFSGFWGFSSLFAERDILERNPGLFGLLFLNNIAYLAALAVLIVLLALKGTEGANRFGPPSG